MRRNGGYGPHGKVTAAIILSANIRNDSKSNPVRMNEKLFAFIVTCSSGRVGFGASEEGEFLIIPVQALKQKELYVISFSLKSCREFDF